MSSNETPKFRKASAAPELTQVMVPYAERPNPALRMPHPSLFPKEFRHWHSVHDQAAKANDGLLQGVAGRLKSEMQQASRDALTIRMAAQANSQQAIGRLGLISWYDRTTKYLTWSRMWQEMMTGLVSSASQSTEISEAKRLNFLSGWNPDPEATLPQIMVEQGDVEPRCGVQITPSVFQHVFDVDPPDEQHAWLEGSDVFIQTTRPAVPGVVLEAKYRVRNDKFPADEYITARPFLKSEVWQSYVDLL